MTTRVPIVAPQEFVAAAWAEERDDSAASADAIEAGLSEPQRRQLAAARQKLAALTTTAETFKKDGDYTAERREVHRAIIEEFLGEDRVSAAIPADGQPPVLVMLGGRGGSGKSWFKGQVYDPARCIVLDADEIKRRLPEYEGWNAAQVHEESSDILDVLLTYCRDLGINVVLDATMKTGKGVQRRAADFKAAGFRIETHYMHLPRQLAAVRAVARFCSQPGGRYVPAEVILENTQNEANFDDLKRDADAWSFWDNDVAPGEPPTFVSGRGEPALLGP